VRPMRRVGAAEKAHEISVHEAIRILKARFPRGVEALKLMI